MQAFLSWQALEEKCSPNYTRMLGSLSLLPFLDWELSVGFGRSRTFSQSQIAEKIRSY